MADRYIHIEDKRYENSGPLPNEWKYKNYNVCALRKNIPAGLIAKGWRICEFVNETYDSEIQTRTGPVKDVQATKAIFTYTVTDKALNPVRKWKGRQLKQEGWNLLLAKYPDEFDREGAAYLADRATLKNYYNGDLTDMVVAAGTVQAIKNVVATWPTIL